MPSPATRSSPARRAARPTPAGRPPATVLEREILERGNGASRAVAAMTSARTASSAGGRRGSPRAPAGRGRHRPAGGRRTHGRATPRAPRGHSSAPTTTLMPAPMATSCTRTRPVRQPWGEDVEQHDDEDRERRLADDEVHRAGRVCGEEHHERQQDPEPGVVTPNGHQHRGCDAEAEQRAGERLRARSRRCRARWSAAPPAPPSTTQKACSTEVVFATSTASASPRPARAALRKRTERTLQWARRSAQLQLATAAGPRAVARCRAGRVRRRRRSASRRARAGAAGRSRAKPVDDARRAVGGSTAAAQRSSARGVRDHARSASVARHRSRRRTRPATRPGARRQRIRSRAASACTPACGSATAELLGRGHRAPATGPGGGSR